MEEALPNALQRKALELLHEREDVENLRLGRIDEDEDPSTGKKLYRIDAFSTDDPNGPRYQVVLDEEGEEVDAEGLAEREDKDFFAREPFEPGSPRPMAGPAASITIEPTDNILVLNPGDTSEEIVTVKVPPNVGVSKVDVYFLADTTGSMDSILTAVQNGASNILDALNALGLDMVFGVGNYKDFQPGAEFPAPFAFQHQLNPTTTVADVKNAFNAWSASGGSDTPEGQLFALDQLAEPPGGTIGWRSDAKRIIVWFGDAPGHDPVCAAASGLPFDITEASATAKLVAQNISVIAISTDTGVPGALDGDPTDGDDYADVCGPAGGSPGQGTRIASATGGTHATGIDKTTIVDAITNLVLSAATTINNLNLVPTGETAPFVVSITPAAGYGPLSGDSEHVLKFEVKFRGIPCRDEEQVLDGTLDVVADGAVVAAKKVRITVPACEPKMVRYSVKFVCATQEEGCGCAPVRPGQYATQISIHNYSGETVEIRKYFIPVVLAGAPVGREPKVAKARAEDAIELLPHTATMDDCCRITELLFGAPVDALTIGLLEIIASRDVSVTAVYTTGTSLDVEPIEGRAV
jgi:hypothetical protein